MNIGLKFNAPFDKFTKFIKTNEDWYPSMQPLQRPANPAHHNPLDHEAVRVSIIHLTDGLWRVCVWGDDDFGLELDARSKSVAIRLFNRIRHFTTQAQLKKWGFYPA